MVSCVAFPANALPSGPRPPGVCLRRRDTGLQLPADRAATAALPPHG